MPRKAREVSAAPAVSTSTSPCLAPAFEDCCIGLLAFFRYDTELFEIALKELLNYARSWLMQEVVFTARQGVLIVGNGEMDVCCSSVTRCIISVLALSCVGGACEHAGGVGRLVLSALIEPRQATPSKRQRDEDQATCSSSVITSMLACMFRGPRDDEAAYFSRLHGSSDDDLQQRKSQTATKKGIAPAEELIGAYYHEHPIERAVHGRQLFTNGLFQFFQYNTKAKLWATRFACIEPSCAQMANGVELANTLTLYVVPTLPLSAKLEELMNSEGRAVRSCAATSTSNGALMSVAVARDRIHASFTSLQNQQFKGETRLELLLQFCSKFSVPSSAAVDAVLFGTHVPPQAFQAPMSNLPHFPTRENYGALSEADRALVQQQLSQTLFATYSDSFHTDDETINDLRIWAAASIPMEALFILCHSTSSADPYDQYLIKRYRLPLTRRLTKSELVQCYWADELTSLLRNVLLATKETDEARWAFLQRIVANPHPLKAVLTPSLIPQTSGSNPAPSRSSLIDAVLGMTKGLPHVVGMPPH